MKNSEQKERFGILGLSRFQRKEQNHCPSHQNFSKTKSMSIDNLIKIIKLVVRVKHSLYFVMNKNESSFLILWSIELYSKEHNEWPLCGIFYYQLPV